MNAIVEHQTTLPASPESPQPNELMTALARAAASPKVNIEKMERLWAMQMQLMAMESEKAYNGAMAEAQSEMGRVATNADNTHTKSRYATYGAIDKALRPIYTKHGFALSFNETASDKPGHVRVLCQVSHRAGHSRMYQIDMCADGKGAKGGDVMTATHATGSAHTYARRYLVKDIFNVAIGEEDNDGNGDPPPFDPNDDTARVKSGYISNKEIADLGAMITEVNANEKVFLDWMRVKQLADIPKIQLKTAVRGLEAKRRQS